MKFQNIKKILNMPFDEYLSHTQHWSNSRISSGGAYVHQTQKMGIGKEVDAILGGWGAGSPTSKRIASEIISRYKSLISNLEYQVSYIGEAESEGFVLPFKTRPDFVGKTATIDLKITWSKVIDFPVLIDRMNYHRQCFIHRGMSGLSKSYLMIYSVPDKASKLIDSNEDYSDYLTMFILENGNLI